MQVLESITIKNHNNNTYGFQRVEGFIFCKKCGMQHRENEIKIKCPICGNDDFLQGDFASILSGYIKMDKEGTLKKYYNGKYNTKYGKSSKINMNNRRVVLQLLINDGLLKPGDNSMEEIIRRVMWKKH